MALENNLLDSIHRVSLYLLLEFDRVCKENNLTYSLDSGTALGAVRHGGFIPWDDDIDVGMPRKDYETFLRIAQDLLPSDIFVQTSHTEQNYKRNAAKLRLEGTMSHMFIMDFLWIFFLLTMSRGTRSLPDCMFHSPDSFFG